MSRLSSWFGRGIFSKIVPHLPPLNFITLHYLYFVGTCLVTSLIFWGSSTPAQEVRYVDSLFMVTSAMTEAGLNTVNLSQLNTFQQILLWLHIMGGSAIFVSISVIFFRKQAFERRFGGLLKDQKDQRENERSFEKRQENQARNVQLGTLDREIQQTPFDPESSSVYTEVDPSREHTSSDFNDNTATRPAELDDMITGERGTAHDSGSHIAFSRNTRFAGVPERRRHSQIFNFNGVGAAPVTTSYRRPGEQNMVSRSTSKSDLKSESFMSSSKSFLDTAIIGRNSQFHGLSREDRERLGGAEYKAISLLAWVVPLYFVLWQFLGCLGLGAWIAYNMASVPLENGIDPWWLGAFNAVSAFNNSGMSLLDANMIPFQDAFYVLVTMGLLIIAGNTGYPPFLRLILWTMLRLLPDKPRFQDSRDTLRFVLDHPRRVYTNLFPARQTWWLAFAIITLNGIDWAAFELLNIGNDAIASIPPGARAMDGLFQAIAVRSGGFYVVVIPSLRIGVQVLYVIMMYISVYPVVITMRNSNVYEERSLGIYVDENLPLEDETLEVPRGILGRLRRRVTGQAMGDSRAYFLRQQVKGQLAHDLSWLVVAILFIVCIEVTGFEADPITYSVFNVTFEVVSGYGCVGISTGLPNEAYSFSGGWHTASKLILCAVMIRGRHRGLPVAIDQAVLLPGENLGLREEEDFVIRRSQSRARLDDSV